LNGGVNACSQAIGRCTTVPAHKGRDIAPPLLRQIAKDIGMSVEEFLSYR